MTVLSDNLPYQQPLDSRAVAGWYANEYERRPLDPTCTQRRIFTFYNASIEGRTTQPEHAYARNFGSDCLPESEPE